MPEPTQTIEQDASLDGAVAALANVDIRSEAERTAEKAGHVRDENGRFARPAADDPEEAADDAALAAVAKPNSQDKQPVKEAADDDAEDMIELPPEKDGAEPVRYKVSQLLDSHRRVAEYESEIKKLKAAPALPEEVEQVLSENMRIRSAYLSRLEAMTAALKPREPDVNLINPTSNAYDPTTFYQQLQDYQAKMQQLQGMEAERKRVADEQAAHQDVLTKARLRGEWMKTVEHWPELAKDDVRQKVSKDVAEAYGFSPAELSAISDHRVLRVIKDALAYRSQGAAKEAVAKTVSSKPKLVRSAGRTGAKADIGQRMAALSKSGSLEDGAAAIAALRL